MLEPQGTAQSDGAVTYKIKRVRDREGQLFQIVNQSLNGPCPLLAIVNVLLLRGNILLPQSAPDVSEERLVSLVAGWLLDRTEASQAGQQASLTPDYAANLQQNVSDAVGRLPKLTTGIDINPRFTGCQAYEFTGEVGIFDLLDIPLLHGWLVDPQDEALSKAIGSASYNELLSRLIASLGEDAPPALPLSSAASSPLSAGGTPSTAVALPPARGPTAVGLPQTAEGAKFTLDDDEEDDEEGMLRLDSDSGSFSKRLQTALALSIGTDISDAQRGGTAGSDATKGGSHGVPPAISPNSAAAKAFDSALVTPGHSRSATLLSGADSDRQWHSPPAAEPMGAAGGGDTSRPDKSSSPAQHGSRLSVAHSPGADANAEAYTAVQRLMQVAFGRHLQSDSDPAELEEARLVQRFLSGTSQLTYHGLSELHAALTPGRLAVFFRNNHFSTLTMHSDGSLYMLVTDQGYLREPEVVWERLATIDGDAQFVRADFSPFAPAKSEATQQEGGGLRRHAPVPDSLAQQPANVDADADLALALQMQEEEAAAEEDRRIRAQRQRQEQNQERGSSQRHQAGQPPHTQRRSSGPRQPAAIQGQAPPKDKCSIM